MPIEGIKFLTVMNVLYLEANYHNVGIFMMAKVMKADIKLQNVEEGKCTDWVWVHWDDFLAKDRHFIPFKYFFEQGFSSLDKIKK